MKLKLYHGSENIIEVPEYGKGMRNNDYGRGFYCTEDMELAREWTCFWCQMSHGSLRREIQPILRERLAAK